jgi:hypothetical protein
MTPLTMTQTTLDAPDSGRRHPRSAPSCALCRKAPAATPLGLCVACLAAAAAELTRLTPPAVDARDARPSSVPYRELYREPPCEHGDPRGARGCALCRHARSSARESA